MTVNSVNFGNRPYGYNPKTGQFDPEQAKRDFKPGLIMPDEDIRRRNAARRAAVATGLLGISSIAAAIVFRKPIGRAIGKVAGKVIDFAKPVAKKGLEYAGKAVKFVKGHAQNILAKIVKFFGKNANVASS